MKRTNVYLTLTTALAMAPLVFTTGYQTNLGVISSLVGRRSVAVVDKSDHASIYDGCRLADGEMIRFNHNSATHLESRCFREYKVRR